MFKINNQEKIEQLSVTTIKEGLYLPDFIKNSNNRDVTLCPFNAIDIKNRIITKDCMECGICWVKYPNIIEFKDPDYEKFYSYCEKDKLFVYKWLTLILKNKSGINIRVPGFSRNKRIPLIIQNDDSYYIVKAARTIRDLDYENADLNELVDVILSSHHKLNLYKIIVLMKESKADVKYIRESKDVIVLSLKKLYYNFLKKDIDLNNHLKESVVYGIPDK